VSRKYLAGGPVPFSERRWLAAVVFAVYAELTTVALVVGSHPHDRGQRLLLVLVACGPIVLLRRWPLMVLATATAATGLVMAMGNASLPFGIMLGLASYFVASRRAR
jgi:hypothetical protein